MKAEMELTNEDDGEFWMNMEDFKAGWTRVEVRQI